MRSRAARWTFVTVVWIALVAAGFFLYSSQQHIVTAAAAARTVDLHAREADHALNEARVAQQAYVATGQGVAFWMPKVASTTDAAGVALKAVRDAATADTTRAEIDEATTAMTEFAEVDKRARDYIHASQMLMAGDVIYTEGSQAIASAARHLEMARQAEHQAFDAQEAALRRQQGIALGGAAVLAALVAVLLAPATRPEDDASDVSARTDARGATRAGATTLGIDFDEGIVSHARPAPGSAAAMSPAILRPATPPPHARSPVVLKAAADLATDFGRVRDSDELARLLERAAEIIDASGLVVWMGDTTGGDLKAVLSHGYPAEALARMPSVRRDANNATAIAYRTGALQILEREPGGKLGAIVAPILGVEGCIGALSAEINDGGEGSEAVQAVSAIVAAHLASVLAVNATVEAPMIEEPRAAAQG
jgi:hypothetical protein